MKSFFSLLIVVIGCCANIFANAKGILSDFKSLLRSPSLRVPARNSESVVEGASAKKIIASSATANNVNVSAVVAPTYNISAGIITYFVHCNWSR
jgi:hypothetical protein